jgi:hypothetical protein
LTFISELLFGRATLGGAGAVGVSAAGDGAVTQSSVSKQRSLPVNMAQAEHKQMLALIILVFVPNILPKSPSQKNAQRTSVYDGSSVKF